MPRDSGGVYTLPAGYLAVEGETIEPSQHNPPLEDIATALTASVPRNGAAPMTGVLKVADGSEGAPGVAFQSASTRGFYKTTLGIGFSIGGAKAFEIIPGGLADLVGVVDDATNTGVSSALKVSHTTSGTPGTGIGVGMQFEAETSAGNNEIGATIEAVTTDATAASEDFDLVFKLMAAGAAAAEAFRIKSTGSAVFANGWTVTAGGATITAGGLTITAGGLTVTAGSVSLPAGSIANAALANPAGMTLLKVVTASNSATLDFVHGAAGVVFDTTYDTYVFEFVNLIPQTDDRPLVARVGTGATPTYLTGAYAYSFADLAGANSSATSAASLFLCRLTGSSLSVSNGATDGGVSGTFKITTPAGAHVHRVWWQVAYVKADDSAGSVVGGGHDFQTTALTAIRFMFDSGNIVSGSIKMYGLTKS